jgi:hypothetical protein
MVWGMDGSGNSLPGCLATLGWTGEAPVPTQASPHGGTVTAPAGRRSKLRLYRRGGGLTEPGAPLFAVFEGGRPQRQAA